MLLLAWGMAATVLMVRTLEQVDNGTFKEDFKWLNRKR